MKTFLKKKIKKKLKKKMSRSENCNEKKIGGGESFYLKLAIITVLLVLIESRKKELAKTPDPIIGTNAPELNFNLYDHINIRGTMLFASKDGITNDSVNPETIYTVPAGKKLFMREFYLQSTFADIANLFVTAIVTDAADNVLYKCLVKECNNLTQNVAESVTYAGAYRSTCLVLYPGQKLKAYTSSNFTQTSTAKITGILIDESTPLNTSYAYVTSDTTTVPLLNAPTSDSITRVLVGISDGTDQAEQIFQYVTDGTPGVNGFNMRTFMSLNDTDTNGYQVDDKNTNTSVYAFSRRIIDDTRLSIRKENSSSDPGYAIVVFYDLSV